MSSFFAPLLAGFAVGFSLCNVIYSFEGKEEYVEAPTKACIALDSDVGTRTIICGELVDE